MLGYYTNPKKLTLHHDGRIFGTWDFKWPQNTTIRVMFQEPTASLSQSLQGLQNTLDPESADEEKLLRGGHSGVKLLTRIVECLARRWLVRAPSIKLEFTHDAYVAPLPASEKVEVRASSAEIPTAPYDVLISLAALPQHLPVVTPEGANAKLPPRKVFLPSSELGRYTQRIDYGLATTFVGPREHFRSKESDRLLRYFSSPEFHHWVIHEFGHVLGLPHEHQNPEVHQRIKFADGALVVRRLRSALGYSETGEDDITAAEVTSEIFEPWPVVFANGKPQYSDFRTYRKDDKVGDDDSVMFHVFWKRLLDGATGTEPPTFHLRPTARDLAQIDKMYPGR